MSLKVAVGPAWPLDPLPPFLSLFTSFPNGGCREGGSVGGRCCSQACGLPLGRKPRARSPQKIRLLGPTTASAPTGSSAPGPKPWERPPKNPPHRKMKAPSFSKKNTLKEWIITNQGGYFFDGKYSQTTGICPREAAGRLVVRQGRLLPARARFGLILR